MHVDTDNLATLLQIQHIDMEAIRAKKELEKLPQRRVILDARAKKKSIDQKCAQLDALHSEADAKLAGITDEDATLAKKQQAVQAEIDNARGDYRGMEARTKELNGFAKRRNVLEGELNTISEELSKIEAVQAQVTKALAELNAQEAAATETFVKQGGALKDTVARMEAERGRLAASLPEELVKLYTKTASRTGGVAVARLQETSCGACRMSIEPGRLVDMKARGNVEPCPHCGRLLILE